ncbi:MAG: Rpn family recombination-promoting nuclease/putative transposase [Bacteroidota bacterium]
MSQLAERYINPLTDFGFKRLFGTEPNKDLLIDFLNVVLPEVHRVRDLIYRNNENIGNTFIDRKAIFDIYCIGKDGERFIVEMQKAEQKYFKDRSVFYSSFPIQEQSKKKTWNYKLDPVFSVGILDFIFDDHKEENQLLHIVELKNQKGKVFYDKLKFIYIELPKFDKKVSELETRFDKWLYVFTHLWQLQDRPKELQDRVFKKLFKVAEIAKFSKEDRKAYEESLKKYRDIKNVVDSAREKGKAEGRAEGRAEGLVEGRAEGELEGKKNIALKMKEMGMSIQDIRDLTGLSKEEIDKL